MTKPRSVGLGAGLALIGAAAWFLFGTRPAPPALTGEDRATRTEKTALAEVLPPAPRVETRAAERPREFKHPLIYQDPYAGKDLHTLYGKVFDATTGEPVPFFVAYQARVEDGDIEYLARDRRYAKIFSNKLGAFKFRGLERGRYNLLIRATGYDDAVVRGIELPMTEEELRVAVSRGAWVQVECVDSSGDGVSDIEVRLVPVQLDDPDGRQVQVRLRRTDAYGRALFTNLPTGVYHVKLLNEHLNPYPSQDFYLGPEGNFPVRFVVQPLNDVTVRIKDEDKNPLGNVHVRMWSRGADLGTYRVETAPDGTGTMSFVPKGEYTLKLWKIGFKRMTKDIVITSESGEQTVDITMFVDPTGGWAEENPTPEQLERLKNGEDPADVFGIVDKGGGGGGG